eukprot:s243_g23.t1
MAMPMQQPYAVIRTVGAAAVPPVNLQQIRRPHPGEHGVMEQSPITTPGRAMATAPVMAAPPQTPGRSGSSGAIGSYPQRGRHAMHSGGALPGAEASMVSGGHSGACPSGPQTNMVRTNPQVMPGAQQRMPSPEAGSLRLITGGQQAAVPAPTTLISQNHLAYTGSTPVLGRGSFGQAAPYPAPGVPGVPGVPVGVPAPHSARGCCGSGGRGAALAAAMGQAGGAEPHRLCEFLLNQLHARVQQSQQEREQELRKQLMELKDMEDAGHLKVRRRGNLLMIGTECLADEPRKDLFTRAKEEVHQAFGTDGQVTSSLNRCLFEHHATGFQLQETSHPEEKEFQVTGECNEIVTKVGDFEDQGWVIPVGGSWRLMRGGIYRWTIRIEQKCSGRPQLQLGIHGANHNQPWRLVTTSRCSWSRDDEPWQDRPNGDRLIDEGSFVHIEVDMIGINSTTGSFSLAIDDGPFEEFFDDIPLSQPYSLIPVVSMGGNQSREMRFPRLPRRRNNVLRVAQRCFSYEDTLAYRLYGPKPMAIVVHPVVTAGKSTWGKPWPQILWDAEEALGLARANRWDLLPGTLEQWSRPNQIPSGGWDHEAFSKAEAADLLRRSTSRALQAPEGWHLDRGEEESDDEYDIHEAAWKNGVIKRQWAETTVVKIRLIDPNTYFGKGKTNELAMYVAEMLGEQLESLRLRLREHHVDPYAVQEFGNRLQQCCGGGNPGLEVIDRNRLVLEIFNLRAKTPAAKIQVGLAKLEYLKTRLTLSNKTRFKETMQMLQEEVGPFKEVKGFRTDVDVQYHYELKPFETERALIRQAEARLKRMLETEKKSRKQQRQNREGVPTIGIVGYTNAGKTSLMNRITHAGLRERDLMFQTLDTTMRKVKLPSGGHAIIADSIGFIQHLPHSLFAAFQSTLEEIIHCDVLLHVRDIAHPQRTMQKDIVLKTLRSAGMSEQKLQSAVIEAFLVSAAMAIGVSVRRFRLGICLVQSCLAWLLCDTFATFAGWNWVSRPQGHRAAQIRRSSQPRIAGQADIEKWLAAELASDIETAQEWHLISLLDTNLDHSHFDGVAALAAYRQLVNKSIYWVREEYSSVILRLHDRVEAMARHDQLDEQVLSDIFWSIAQISDPLKLPIPLLSTLVESLPSKVNGMSAQGLSNRLEACAKLKDSVPGVLKIVPDISLQDMNEPDLTKCLWALARLKDVSKKLVPVIATHINTEDFRLYFPKWIELSADLLWAVAELKDVTFPILKPELKLVDLAWDVGVSAWRLSPSQLRRCVWAIGQLHEDLHRFCENVDGGQYWDWAEWAECVEEKVAGNESLAADVDQWLRAVKWFQKQPEVLRQDAQEALNEVFAGNLKADTLEKFQWPGIWKLYLGPTFSELLLSDPGSKTDLARTVATDFNNKMLPYIFFEEPAGPTMMIIVFLCAKHGLRDDELLTAVSEHFVRSRFSSLPDFELCSLSWAYQSLAQDDFRDFQKLLAEEVAKRGLSQADVKRCRHGVFFWKESTPSNARDFLTRCK